MKNILLLPILIALLASNFTQIHAQVPTVVTVGGEFDTVGSVFQLAVSELYANLRRRTEKGPTLLFAGADYQGPWTRDASINVTQSGPLLPGKIAENTLYEVTDREKEVIIGQYWDKIIWVTAAWRHYLYTGDKVFLQKAYSIGLKTFNQQFVNEFDSTNGLFRGPAVYGDGIAAYDDRYTRTGNYRQGGAWLSNIDKWPEANPDKKAKKGWGLPMFTLSTNCVYAGAILALDSMAVVLKKPEHEILETQYNLLKKAIRAGFWPNKNFGALPLYYFDSEYKCTYQEGLGIAFAARFGIISPGELAKLPITSSANGICCVFPSFPRYTAKGGLGRHSGVIWPMVNGFFALQASEAGLNKDFELEFRALTNNTWRDRQFREIYNPNTGLPYGGLQEDGFKKDYIREWLSTYRQTWSATAWISMFMEGIVGIKFTSTGIYFNPNLPEGVPSVSLHDYPYRDAILNIQLKGKGKLKTVLLDGVQVPSVPATLKGNHTVSLVLGN
jgi:hypothetical protein